MATSTTASGVIDGPAAWMRLIAALALGSIGGAGMWSVVVALPAVQDEFGVARGAASLPYALTTIGFGLGGVLMGRLSDRFGILLPVVIGAISLSLGYILAGFSQNLWQYAIVHGVLIGLGTSTVFAPMMADISHWFRRRRGIAVSICACGNYVAGTIWPPVLQHFIATQGWRPTLIGFGIFCALTMLPLALAFRRKLPKADREAGLAMPAGSSASPGGWQPRDLGISSGTLQTLLIVAGVGCCVAMSMPQVHLVAYCGDLGYGPARGAEMLSVMLGLGIISRLASGLIADRLGGIATLLLGSLLQGVALLLYLPFDGLVSLYVVSGLFGLFQGGIVPMYAIIVREYFSPREAGARVGIVIMATLFGMAFGGWISGAIFDLTGSYKAAFANGVLWNLLNVAIVSWLLIRSRRPLQPA